MRGSFTQEVNGRKLLLAFENGEIVAKEVVLVCLSRLSPMNLYPAKTASAQVGVEMLFARCCHGVCNTVR